MKVVLTVVFSLVLSTNFLAQDVSREQKFQQIRGPNAQITRPAGKLLLPEMELKFLPYCLKTKITSRGRA